MKDRKILHATCVGLAESMELIKAGSHEAILIGWMTYKNRGGATGYTAFGRVYNPTKAGFVMIEDDKIIPEHDRWEHRA